MPAQQLTSTMNLDELLRGLADAPDIPIRGIASDTRELQEGYLFLACAGIRSHGLDHAHEAVDAGAVAVAFDSATATEVPALDLPQYPVDGLRAHLGAIANRFFDRPSYALKVVGVTGTNGKTTVSWLLAQCLNRLGYRCAYTGTLGFGLCEIDAEAGMTTPDVIELHRRLAVFRDAGATHAAVEVSSHALAQHRIDGVRIDSALFTNLSRDHLDFHGDMRAYADAKASLFLDAEPARRIINLDTAFGERLASRCGADVVTVSTDFDRDADGRPHVFVRSIVTQPEGSEIGIHSSWGDGTIVLPLPGAFNVANAVIVLASLLSEGATLAAAGAALATVEAPPGRLQQVAVDSAGPAVFVDYAHTPGALEGVLRAVRPHCRGQLWCVFGCGGNRDVGKRPLMASIAERFADRVVVTSDNPRDEDPAEIITAIVGGLHAPECATIIEDRAAAIAWVIGHAAARDVVLLAGKGHENYQLIGDERRDFSDYGAAAANLLARSRGGEGSA